MADLSSLQVLSLAFAAAGGAVGSLLSARLERPWMRRTIAAAVKRENKQQRDRIEALERHAYGASRRWTDDEGEEHAPAQPQPP